MSWYFFNDARQLAGRSATASRQAPPLTGNLLEKSTAAGATLRVKYSWTRNRAGHILTESYTKGSDAMIPASYDYDAIGRLSAFTRDLATTSYGWQAVPNRASVQYASDPALVTTYNDANRPTSHSAGGSYSNDDEGRLTARPVGTGTEVIQIGRVARAVVARELQPTLVAPRRGQGTCRLGDGAAIGVVAEGIRNTAA